MKIVFSRWVLEKYTHTKFNENSSSESRVFPREQTGRQADGKTDMMKLIVAFRNFAKAPKNLNHGSRTKGTDLSKLFPA
jgi:hypothetical protein